MNELREKIKAAVNGDRLLETATALIEVPSPTLSAADVAGRLDELLRADGFDVERPVCDWPESPAVVARLGFGEGGRVLQVDGHLDTVHLPFVPPRVEDGVLYGSGCSDMKGGIAAAVYILAWFWKSGIDLYIAVLLLASVMIVYVGLTRLAIQSGVLYITATFSPQALTTAITGTDVNPHALVGIALSYSWASDIQSIFMTAAAHGARLNELGRHQRRLAIAIAIAVAVGFAVSIYFLLVIC